MIPIDQYTVGVENEADLRSAVGNNSYNYIYLANNITFTSGITIYTGKTSLVIDGRYPPESGVIHELTDVNSIDYGATLGIRGTSSITLTFRNMTINGRNYFGVPYIVESIWPLIDTSGVTVIYENVTYTGPQMTYNRYGLTRYLDCAITIRQTTGTSQSQEVGEVNRVEIGGNTTIYHTSNVDDRAVFWFNNIAGTSSLTLLSGADVDINSESSYFMYNLEGAIRAPVVYTLQSGASLRLQVNRGISWNQNHPLSSFHVNENASFYYVQTANNGTAASLYLDGVLEVRQGARFYMQAANGTQPLIRFTSGTNRSLTVDNVISFVLYSPNTAALNSQATTAFTLRGGQMNTWSTARTPRESAGGFDDMPEFRWFKRDYAQPVLFMGTFTTTVTTATGNMTAEDEPHPADTDLHLHSARVLSLGDWPVDVDPVVEDGRPITGQTEPDANLRVVYEIEGTEHSLDGTADESGRFEIATSDETPPTIPAETDVAIWSNIPFLIKMTSVTVVEVGELYIESAPDRIEFRPHPISLNPPLLPRSNPEEQVVVRDMRVESGSSTRWELLASIADHLRAPSGETLFDAVVFVALEGGTQIPLNEEPLLVYTGGPDVLTTPIFWSERAGILVRVTDPIRSGVAYTTQVIWHLRSIEE